MDFGNFEILSCTYSSDELLAGRTHIILTTDTRHRHCNSTYSSDDLLPGRTAIILTTDTRRRRHSVYLLFRSPILIPKSSEEYLKSR